jgi:hypothetical protein
LPDASDSVVLKQSCITRTPIPAFNGFSTFPGHHSGPAPLHEEENSKHDEWVEKLNKYPGHSRRT